MTPPETDVPNCPWCGYSLADRCHPLGCYGYGTADTCEYCFEARWAVLDYVVRAGYSMRDFNAADIATVVAASLVSRLEAEMKGVRGVQR